MHTHSQGDENKLVFGQAGFIEELLVLTESADMEVVARHFLTSSLPPLQHTAFTIIDKFLATSETYCAHARGTFFSLNQAALIFTIRLVDTRSTPVDLCQLVE